MPTNLTITEVKDSIAWTYTNTNPIGGQTTDSNRVSSTISGSLTNGTGASQASILYAATSTIAASGTAVLDLYGSLTDVFGNTINTAKIKGIKITLNTDSAAASILVGGGTAPVASLWGTAGDQLRIRNGYSFVLYGQDAGGYAVTATTADKLTITNEDASLTAYYTIVLYGA